MKNSEALLPLSPNVFIIPRIIVLLTVISLTLLVPLQATRVRPSAKVNVKSITKWVTPSKRKKTVRVPVLSSPSCPWKRSVFFVMVIFVACFPCTRVDVGKLETSRYRSSFNQSLVAADTLRPPDGQLRDASSIAYVDVLNRTTLDWTNHKRSTPETFSQPVHTDATALKDSLKPKDRMQFVCSASVSSINSSISPNYPDPNSTEDRGVCIASSMKNGHVNRQLLLNFDETILFLLVVSYYAVYVYSTSSSNESENALPLHNVNDENDGALQGDVMRVSEATDNEMSQSVRVHGYRFQKSSRLTGVRSLVKKVYDKKMMLVHGDHFLPAIIVIKTSSGLVVQRPAKKVYNNEMFRLTLVHGDHFQPIKTNSGLTVMRRRAKKDLPGSNYEPEVVPCHIPDTELTGIGTASFGTVVEPNVTYQPERTTLPCGVPNAGPVLENDVPVLLNGMGGIAAHQVQVGNMHDNLIK